MKRSKQSFGSRTLEYDAKENLQNHVQVIRVIR